MDTIEAIMTRRSVPLCADDVPPREVIERLLAAAVRAPNHRLTEPWRFVVLTGPAREELGAAWAAGEAAEGGDPEKVMSKGLRAPVIICVIERPRESARVVEIEEHHAVGAAMQNILLAAHSLGLGAMVRTGAAGYLPQVKEYLGLDDKEFVAGFIYVGYPADGPERPMTRRTDASELTDWRGSE